MTTFPVLAHDVSVMISQPVDMDNPAFVFNGYDVYSIQIKDWERELYRDTGIITHREFEIDDRGERTKKKAPLHFLPPYTAIPVGETVKEKSK